MKFMAHPYLNGGPAPRVLAHRGFVSQSDASRGVVENSRAAITAAVAAGATFVESDCHLTADGRVVLAHDPDLSRVLGDPRNVTSVTHAEFAELMRGRGGLLTLDEALDEFPQTRFNIDVKAESVTGPAGRIIGRHGERVLLTSFSDSLRLRALRAADGVPGVRPATSPGRARLVRILISIRVGSRALIGRSLAGLDALQIPERHGRIQVLSPRLIEAAHTHGVEVHVWTVNDPARMVELVERGVDGIITDRYDLAVAALTPRE